ncbi:hypothetical protein EVAR_90944_1 [Eumeta japonica]|uniref:Uncharacterized protein n=1 Tax=Eumeta variegata TaxID=151549 RepID=A0A4C1SEX9_EUMVA|nr:hypothetical protein EVAR_90944_1 [Eumeta japonica]
MTHCRVPPEPGVQARARNERSLPLHRPMRPSRRETAATITYTCSTICLATEFTEFTLSGPAWRAGRGSGGRQSHVGSIKLFLFLPRSTGGRQLGVLRARVI